MKVVVDYGDGLSRVIETRRLADLERRYRVLGWGCRLCQYYEPSTDGGGAYGRVAVHSLTHSAKIQVASYCSPLPEDWWDRVSIFLFGRVVLIQCDTCYGLLASQVELHDCAEVHE